jgi:hypothetical protein
MRTILPELICAEDFHDTTAVGRVQTSRRAGGVVQSRVLDKDE